MENETRRKSWLYTERNARSRLTKILQTLLTIMIFWHSGPNNQQTLVFCEKESDLQFWWQSWQAIMVNSRYVLRWLAEHPRNQDRCWQIGPKQLSFGSVVSAEKRPLLAIQKTNVKGKNSKYKALYQILKEWLRFCENGRNRPRKIPWSWGWDCSIAHELAPTRH